MIPDAVRKYVGAQPDTPEGIEAWRWMQAQEHERKVWVVREEPMLTPWPGRWIPRPSPATPVEPSYKVVDADGCLWSMGWSEDARTVVYWRLGRPTNPLDPPYNPYRDGVW